VSYRQILAQIALEHHKSGGADINAEVARRFLADGDAPKMPLDSQGNPVPDLDLQPAQSLPEAVESWANQPAPIRAQYDNQGNVIGEGTAPGQVAVGTNPDGSLMQQPAAGTPPASEPEKNYSEQPKEPTTKALPPQPAAQPKPVSRGTGGAKPAAAQPSDLEKDVQAGTTEQAKGIQETADVAQQRANQAAPEQRDIANQQQALVDRNNMVQQFVQENKKRLLQKQEMMTDAYANASIDPHRLWNSMDTGHKILAGLSLMLSGNGDGSPVMRAINQDVDLQKEQIERTGKAAGMVGQIFDEYSKIGLDSTQALQMAVHTSAEVGLQRAAATAAQFAGPEAGAKAKIQLGNNTIEGATHQMNMRKTISDIALQRAQAAEAAERAKGQRLTNTITQSQIDWQKEHNLPPGASAQNMVHDLEGNQGYAVGGDADKKGYEDDTRDAANLLAAAQKIKTLRRGGSKSAILANQSALQQEALVLNQGLLGLSAKPGMLSARTEKIAEEAGGDPARYFAILPSQDVDHRLDSIIEDAKGAAQRAEMQHNIIFPQRAPSIVQRQGKVKRG
jgi:hypothetical protein